ncbi:MAG: FlgO family outer membrane protein [Desulfurivibrionaceae bacterium]
MKLICFRNLLNSLPVVLFLVFVVSLVNASPEAETSRQKGASAVSDEQGDKARELPELRRDRQYVPSSLRSRSTEKMISDISGKAAGKVYHDLTDKEENLTAKVAVVAAVPLSDLKRETEFGRLMAEYLLTDLADRGIKVTELRLGKEIHILAQTGEFILSRNIGELPRISRKLDYVLVSTFSNTRKELIVQGRLVNLENGLIKTSWRDTLPLNREILGLFNKVPKPHTIAVKQMN